MTKAHGNDGHREGHGHGDPHHLRHPDGEAGGKSPEEKLVIRLEHLLAHNRDHGATYRKLSEEAGERGDAGAADHIRSAGALVEAQNREIEKALARLRDRFGVSPAKAP
jgi:hypothetical protein